MCEDCVSPTTLLVDGWAANSSVISPTAAQSNGSISRLRRATAPTTTPKVATPYIKISARRRRVERALQLLRPSSPDGAFGQKVGRRGTPKKQGCAWVKRYFGCNALQNACSFGHSRLTMHPGTSMGVPLQRPGPYGRAGMLK